MRHPKNPIYLSLVLVGLAILCLSLATVFERQYGLASVVVSHAMSVAKNRGDGSEASLIGLPNPETYKRRVQMMFWLLVPVFIVSGAFAVRVKHWSYWLTVCF